MADLKTIQTISSFNALVGYLNALCGGMPVTSEYLKRLHEHYLPALEEAIKELEKHHG